MDVTFDISQDELPIFIAEADEHLQTLDEILVQLEQTDDATALLNSAFRSAHTLKGMSGIIGHQRMTNLTHALETAMDAVRKKELDISTPLIDLCLDAVDSLRSLREEIVSAQASPVDVESLVERFHAFSANPSAPKAAVTPPVHETAPAAETEATPPAQTSVDGPIQIEATIEPGSIASAARAFQLMLALQELGEITHMDPALEQIETAAPVKIFSAQVTSAAPIEEIVRKLAQISEVAALKVNGKDFGNGNGQSAGKKNGKSVKPAAQSPVKAPAVQASEPAAATPPPAVRPETPEKDNGAKKNSAEMTVRTSVERLDKLLNLVGELITDRNHLNQLRNRLERETKGDNTVEMLSSTVAHLGRITDQLQEEVMQIRMLPVGSVFHKFPRVVRDMAQKTGKQIDLIIHGEDTELDRSMLEEINDPLIHLVRNAVDHGIESPDARIAAGKSPRGTITLNACHEQGHILITVSDDGGGIDPAKLRKVVVAKGLMSEEEANALNDEQAIDLIFMPGFSTAAKVTDISGRGVGLDIVHNNIQHINGSIQIETKLGQGTTFHITLPLTLAIVPTLLVEVGKSTFAIPLVMVTETLRLERGDIKTIKGKPVTLLRGSILPLVFLSDMFHFKEKKTSSKHTYAVVVHSGKQRVGLMVDALTGEEEVVVKSLSALVGDIPGIASAAILGDGKVALIVDVTGLLKISVNR